MRLCRFLHKFSPRKNELEGQGPIQDPSRGQSGEFPKGMASHGLRLFPLFGHKKTGPLHKKNGRLGYRGL
jgi:hypothetical protein